MLLYGAYGYLGHLRWRSIRARGVPMCSAVTWLRHATTCAHTVRLLSAHFDFSAIVYRCPIAIYPNRPYGYRIQKLLLFLRKIILLFAIQHPSTDFNIHHLQSAIVRSSAILCQNSHQLSQYASSPIDMVLHPPFRRFASMRLLPFH